MYNSIEEYNDNLRATDYEGAYYLITTGKKSVMYTLWFINEDCDARDERNYIMNLSENIEEAKEKALDYVLENNEGSKEEWLSIKVLENKFNDRREHNYFLRLKSGKYEGEMLSDVLKIDAKYLLGMLSGAKEKEENIEEAYRSGWTGRMNYNNPDWSLLLTKREKWLLDNEKNIWAEYNNQNPKEPSKSVFFGEIKQKVKGHLLQCVNSGILYTNQWGTTYFQLFKDTDENVFVYKGTTPPFSNQKEKLSSLGVWFTCNFTVKEHTEFKGVKQTVIQRVKIIDQSVITDEDKEILVETEMVNRNQELYQNRWDDKGKPKTEWIEFYDECEALINKRLENKGITVISLDKL